VNVEPDIWVVADPDLLQQAIQNLTSNAVKTDGIGFGLSIAREIACVHSAA